MKHKQGELVKIKTWEQMEKEYGLLAGDIKIKYSYGFCRDMEKKLKGKSRQAIIAYVGDNYYHVRLSGEEDVWQVKNWPCYLTDEMFEESSHSEGRDKNKMRRQFTFKEKIALYFILLALLVWILLILLILTHFVCRSFSPFFLSSLLIKIL